MKILVVAPQPFFSPRGTPLSVYYRTWVSSLLGHQIDLLTYGDGLDVDIPKLNIIRIPKIPFLGHVKVGPSLPKLFLDIFVFLAMGILLLCSNYEVVDAHEEAAFITLFFRPFFNFSFIYDMHSSLVQQMSNFKFTQSRIIIGIFRKLEEVCLRVADCVITICPDLYHYVNERIPNPKRNFLVENSIFDDVRLKGETIEQGRSGYLSRYSGSGGRRVVYAGTLETYQGIDMLIQGFATVAQCLDDVELIIVGGSTEQVASYRNYAERYGLTRKVWFTGAVSKQEASRWIQRADILVSPRCLGTNTPLKIYELMASGRPLVATRIHSHTQVLDEEAAFLVEPNSDDLAEGIVVALTNPELAKAKASHAQEIYMRSYSKETYIQKMASIFNQLKSCAE